MKNLKGRNFRNYTNCNCNFNLHLGYHKLVENEFVYYDLLHYNFSSFNFICFSFTSFKFLSFLNDLKHNSLVI